MASVPKSAAPVVGQVLELDPSDIDETGRIGLFFPEKAEAYAVLFARDGQHTPIFVRRNGNRAKQPWSLVAGLHRNRGCKIAGLKVRAKVVEGDDDTLKAVQASENLDRRDVAPLERAMLVAATAEAAKRRAYALHGVDNDKALAAKAKAAGVKMTAAERADQVQFTAVEKADAEAVFAGDILSAAYSWSAATAAACGMGVESLKRSLRIFRIIVEPNRDLMDAIKDHAVAQNASALLAICGEGRNPANVRKVIEWLIANPAAKTADEALVALEMMPSRGGKPSAATGDSKLIDRLQFNFQRLSLNGHRRAVAVIVKELPPSALLALREAITARLSELKGTEK